MNLADAIVRLGIGGQVGLVVRVSEAGRVEVTVRIYRDYGTGVGIAWNQDAAVAFEVAFHAAEQSIADLAAAKGEPMLPPKLEAYQRHLNTVTRYNTGKVELVPSRTSRLRWWVAGIVIAAAVLLTKLVLR